ncbi:hypothetical protein [Sedimenticola sp.]|uniref:hypothetical protein n=1 Tax=Sedimenticola sp. TaxID=1940285 RepID=UPI003D11B1C8
MQNIRYGFKIYGNHLENLSLLSVFLEKHSDRIKIVQVNFDLLESFPNRKYLIDLLTRYDLGLIIHLDDSDDLLFLSQLMSSFSSVPLVGIVMHGAVARSMKELNLHLSSIAEHYECFISVENTKHSTNFYKKAIKKTPVLSFCFDVGHNWINKTELEKSKFLISRINMLHIHGVIKGNDHERLSRKNRKSLVKLLSRISFDGGVVVFEIKNIFYLKREVFSEFDKLLVASRREYREREKGQNAEQGHPPLN